MYRQWRGQGGGGAARQGREAAIDTAHGCSNPGELLYGFSIGEPNGLGPAVLQLGANLLSGSLVLPVACWLLDGKQELLGKALDATQAANCRDPSIAVTVDFGAGCFCEVKGFDNLAGDVSLVMHKGHDDIVSIVTELLVQLIEWGELNLLEEVAQAAPHDDFLVLAVAGELAFDVEVEKLVQFCFGVGRQHGRDLSKMECCLARADHFLEGGDAGLDLVPEHKLVCLIVPAGDAAEFL